MKGPELVLFTLTRLKEEGANFDWRALMSDEKPLKFSICMPAYNGGEVVGETIKSILSQSFGDYEFIIVDDNSTDDTAEVIKSFKDPRIKYFKNKKNLGYSKNLEVCRNKAKNEVLFLMGQDDILGKDALLNTYNAFKVSDDIGAVTRSYFWFDKDINTPVRAKDQLNPKKDEIITIEDNPDRIIKMFKTLDQLSGLAYRRKYIDLPFHKDVFPCHVYPFASIFKKHPVVFLKGYNVAVRIGTSQTRIISSIYDESPLQSWVDMFETVFFEKKFRDLKNYLVKNFVATNYVGLVQIRNYARYKYLLREIYLLLKYRPQNVVNPVFWFFSLGTLIMPRKVLIPLVDNFKKRILSQRLKDIRFDYSLK